MLKKLVHFKIMSAFCFRSTSIKSPPLQNFITDLGVPIKAESCFSIMKRLSSVSDLELFDLIIRKRGKLPQQGYQRDILVYIANIYNLHNLPISHCLLRYVLLYL
jgi:hypothetical protein